MRRMTSALAVILVSSLAAVAAAVAPLDLPLPTTPRDFLQPGTQPETLTDPIFASTNCRDCHGNFDPEMEPYARWAGSMMAQATRDPIIALGSLLAQISGSLGKLGMDVTLLAQNEVGAVRLEGGGGSSAMSHKSNPVNAEVLVALARYNAGLAGTLNQALIHENERSGAAWTLEWLTLPPMLVTTGASLRLAALLLGQLIIAVPD